MRGQLTVEAPKYHLLRQRLLAEYPNLDEETVADTLGGNHGPPRDDSRGDPLGASG